jgi:hypothetical protein
MPNHCYNILTLTDNPPKTKSAIKKFLSKDEKGDEFLDFNKIIKMPPALQITSSNADESTKEGKKLKKQQDSNLEKYGYKDWYDWCVDNWGTKWNSYDVSINEDSIGFNTAWSPPTPVIIELAEKTGKDWTLRYSEPGCDFCGELTAYKDGMHNDESWSLRTAPPEFIKAMGLTEEDIYSEEEIKERRKKAAAKKRIRKAISKKGEKNIIDID